jgi:hypothetical protein
VLPKKYSETQKPKMRCFVTVGTTRFDALIETVLTEQTLLSLQGLGFNELSIQSGNFDVETYVKGLDYFGDFSSHNDIFYAKAHDLNVSYFIDIHILFGYLDSLQILLSVYCTRDAKC